MIKVYGCQSENTAVGAYRIWQPFKYLAKKLLADAAHTPIAKDLYFALTKTDPQRTDLVKSWEEWGEWADVVVRQKIWTPQQLAHALAVRETYKVPLVVDLDDDLLHVHKDNVAHKAYSQFEAKDMMDHVEIGKDDVEKYYKQGYEIFQRGLGQLFAVRPKEGTKAGFYTLKLIEQADALTVTNQELKNAYSKYNANIHVLPNYMDVARWEGVQRRKWNPELVVIGWYGGHSHAADLMLLNEVVPALLKKYRNVRFFWAGMIPQEWEKMIRKYGNRMMVFPWTEDMQKWENHFAQFGFDITLAPLVDNQFNRCKSNIKWMESAMLQIPVVASDVGPYQCIQHGVDGFRVNNTQEWLDTIGQLVENPELRDQIGKAAHDRVVKDYSIENHVDDWAHVYQTVRTKYNLKEANIYV